MKLQCYSIIQDFYQWMTADKHLRASDEQGQQWKFYLIKDSVTDEEKIQRAAEVEQLPKEVQVLEPVSAAATVDASDGEESEGEKDQGSPDLQEAS